MPAQTTSLAQKNFSKPSSRSPHPAGPSTAPAHVHIPFTPVLAPPSPLRFHILVPYYTIFLLKTGTTLTFLFYFSTVTNLFCLSLCLLRSKPRSKFSCMSHKQLMLKGIKCWGPCIHPVLTHCLLPYLLARECEHLVIAWMRIARFHA